MMRFFRVAASAVAAVLVAGCGAGSSDGGGGDGLSPPAGLPASLTGQELDWGRCGAASDGPAPGDGWQCATLEVPLNHAKPKGATMDVELIRGRSTGGPGERVGSLLLNFGGPGASGVAYLPGYGDLLSTLRERYDLVSFDPRGVGSSEGVRCRDDEEIQAAESVDTTPDTAAEERAYFEDAADFGRGCAQDAGEVLGHIATTDTARDMDLMRHVLGDRTLHYLGFSYGTELGGVYAHLFPGNVGRMVLDAVVDPTADTVGQARNQTLGFQRALDAYLESTGQDPEKGSQRIADLLKKIDAEPLRTSTDRELTETSALTGLIQPLYGERSWPALTGALEAAERGDGSGLLKLADEYNERDSSGHYGTVTHAQRAISCSDDRRRPTPEQARKLLPGFRKISPVFGAYMAWDTAGWCHDWPVAGRFDTPEVSAPGADPILLVGNTGDPATPYEGTRRMAEELGEGVGVQLTWKGEGHTAYGSGSECVDSTVESYLLDGTVPKNGKVCAS
ncbi:alpha/beta hydrolase [Streptomyces minutiscleroticus]|nr:alpha/beta hydrolase [Streptomyces minutiscleroticus]